MKESLELRVWEKHATEVFSPSEGKRLGDLIRQVVLPASDPRLARIGDLQKFYRARKGEFFCGWELHRRYSAEELDRAELFHFQITGLVNTSGELCGTVYDGSGACKQLFREHDFTVPHGHRVHYTEYCGAGTRQVSDLFLDLRKVPKSKDIARTFSYEWIVSERLADLLTGANMTGLELVPVKHRGDYYADAPIDLRRYPSGKELLRRAEAAGKPYKSAAFDMWLARREQKELWDRAVREQAEAKEERERKHPPRVSKWYQPVITAHPVSTLPPTRFGIDPVDEDAEGRFRCPLGHTSGFAVVSEITISKSSWDGSDIACTKQMVGIRRPSPLLLISPRFWRLLRENNIKGYKVEVAHFA